MENVLCINCIKLIGQEISNRRTIDSPSEDDRQCVGCGRYIYRKFTCEEYEIETVKEVINNGMKRCPFCGCGAEIRESWHGHSHSLYYPSCLKDSCPAFNMEQDQGGNQCQTKTKDEAIEMWNRRNQKGD